MLRRALIVVITLVAVASAYGQSALETVRRAGSSVTVEMPEGLEQQIAERSVVDKSEADGEETTVNASEQEEVYKPRAERSVGYRVQVFADNNVRTAKGEARGRERKIAAAFPQYGTYVAYAAPYWRLRVGDFRSQYDAEKAAGELRKMFPAYAREIRVVRDKINVR